MKPAINWAVCGLLICVIFGLNLGWTLIITVATAAAGAL